MAHRTQVILEDRQYELLREESARTGRSLAELVRRAVDEVYGRSGGDPAAVLRATKGRWCEPRRGP